jgi:hypothetical protein
LLHINFKETLTATLLNPDWLAILRQTLSGDQIRLVISRRSRILRSLLAASTLHLMLAVPARACPSENDHSAAPDPHAAHTMAAPVSVGSHATDSSPMSHAGHQMASMAEQPTAPERPHENDPHQMPCCPSPASGCVSASCVAPVAAVSATVVSVPVAPASVVPTLVAGRWVSVAHPPEPPPPRA